jgi:ribosomal-protein-alanine N-acetyltransferase
MFYLRRIFTIGASGDAHEPPAAAPASPEPVIRAMARVDLQAVYAIESVSHPNAWKEADFQRWLRHTSVSAHVLEEGGSVRAFFLVQRESELLRVANIAVDPEHRRRGLARQALVAIENIARAFGLPRVSLEVRETNLGAQLLYRHAGFRAVEILPAYYGDEDGYRMVKPVPRAAVGPQSSRPE